MSAAANVYKRQTAAYKRAAAWAPEAITLPTTLERIEALEALGNDILAAMFGGE